MLLPLKGWSYGYYTSESAILHLPFLNSRHMICSLRVSPTVIRINQVNDRMLGRSIPRPTSDSILNRKLAGWDGVIVFWVVERSPEGTALTDVPGYQKTEGGTE